ncbi:MAG: hypothetical protein M1826_006568 [Phylliscum demangeonii]|nr:MAG: hypothetical protein M1826_006568 [Phylliscum demangeonii]
MSDASTEPSTPDSFAEDVTCASSPDVFARLLPLHGPASDAIDAVVKIVILEPSKFSHHRRFLHIEEGPFRESTVFTEDEREDDRAATEAVRRIQKTASFQLSLTTLPTNPAEGWYLGTSRGRSSTEDVNLLLAPPTGRRMRRDVAGRHARLFLHLESCRVVVEARHTLTLGRRGTTALSHLAQQVIQPYEMIKIGECLYTFEYTDFFSTPTFDEQLSAYMKKYCHSTWAAHQHVSPRSVAEPRELGNYYFSPRAIAQGTFGRVVAGWAKNGSAVAIKQFKNPRREKYDAHLRMMGKIGRHDNLLHLLASEAHFDSEAPDAYCVYAPLLVASLYNVIDGYVPDLHTKRQLLHDYAAGLAYLHDELGLMHLDINPNNLGVTSIENPKGVIIDLDSVTDSLSSSDHMQGTLTFLAPEIVDLKRWEEHGRIGQSPPPFGREVDMSQHAGFALGQPFFMGSADTAGFREPAAANRVSKLKFDRYSSNIASELLSTTNKEVKEFLVWIQAMLQYKRNKRARAADLLKLIADSTPSGEPRKGQMRPKATLKKRKRPAE